MDKLKPTFEQLLEGAKIELARGRGAANCTYTRAAKGLAYPRTCKRCGLGPCAFQNYLLAAREEATRG